MGIGTLRLHPDPAADDRAGPAPPASRGSRWPPRTTSATSRERWPAPPHRGWPGRRSAWRASLVVLVTTLAAMPLLSNTIGLAAAADSRRIRQRSGVRDRRQLDAGSSGGIATLPGWGFGGVGLGIALSGALVLAMPADAGWQAAWWTAAALAAVLSIGAWAMQRDIPSRRRCRASPFRGNVAHARAAGSPCCS